MSILIMGMELPKDHVRVLVLHPDGRVIDEWGNTYQAAPLPEHGDLIDRDELYLIMRGDERYHGYLSIADLARARTVIPAEGGE